MKNRSTVTDVTAFLRQLAPPELAESWDNTGLLVGDPAAKVSQVMTCLTLSADVAREAVDAGAHLVITHHPVLFRPVQRLTTETIEGRLLCELIAAGISVYSPHTSYDSAAAGINRQLAELFELDDIGILRPIEPTADPVQGAGRFGRLPQPLKLADLAELVKQRLDVSALQFVGESWRTIERLAIACGSAAEFLADAHKHGCQALLTGEARFHACLEARQLGMAMLLPGHYATERPAMERLARMLAEEFPRLTVWASREETDPVQWA